MSFDNIVDTIKQERKSIGDIIDDRSLNCIPFYSYTKEYEKLTKLIDFCEKLKEEYK